ncbi:MAG: hypothetical protein NT045_08520 [Candidatus Aureabacteria bacterium]|nr:hypothetical protein [Candidatus Auribacterota bacterium]
MAGRPAVRGVVRSNDNRSPQNQYNGGARSYDIDTFDTGIYGRTWRGSPDNIKNPSMNSF